MSVTRRVLQQRLQRSQAEHFVENFVGQPVALADAERYAVLADQLQDQREQLLAAVRVLHEQQLLQIDFLDQLAMHRRLHFLLRSSQQRVGRATDLKRRAKAMVQQGRLQPWVLLTSNAFCRG